VLLEVMYLFLHTISVRMSTQPFECRTEVQKTIFLIHQFIIQNVMTGHVIKWHLWLSLLSQYLFFNCWTHKREWLSSNATCLLNSHPPSLMAVSESSLTNTTFSPDSNPNHTNKVTSEYNCKDTCGCSMSRVSVGQRQCGKVMSSEGRSVLG